MAVQGLCSVLSRAKRCCRRVRLHGEASGLGTHGMRGASALLSLGQLSSGQPWARCLASLRAGEGFWWWLCYN